MRSYSTAIIGCGNIAGKWNADKNVQSVLTHAKAYEKHTATQLISCCDTDGAAADEFARRWGLSRHYTSVDKMLAEEAPDFVSICTPTAFHLQAVQQVVSSHHKPLAVLLEKPVADNFKDAAEIASLLRQAEIPCNVNYTRRFDPSIRSIQELVTSLKLGKVAQFRGLYTKGISNNGSHLVNLLRFFLGPVENRHVLHHFFEFEKDPTVTAFLSFSNNCHGIIQGWREDKYSIFELELMLETGRVNFLDFGNRVELFYAQRDPIYPEYTILNPQPEIIRTDLNNALYFYIENTIDAIENRDALFSPIEDALEDVLIISELKRDLPYA